MQNLFYRQCAAGCTLATMIFGGGVCSATESLLEPFASANRNPFVQLYGLPRSQSAHITPVGQWAVAAQLEVANSFTTATKGGEAIVIDGESYRGELQLRRGVSDRLELSIAIPYLRHEGGSLDGFIEDWHDWFGLPDGGRPGYPKDRLRYAYSQQGQQWVNVEGSRDGLGDISVGAGYVLAQSPERLWTVRTQVELPTGDAGDLLGSESTDVSLGLHVSDNSWLQRYGLALHGSVGALWMSDGDVLDGLREDWALYGSGTLAWRAGERFSLKLQIDAHTALYNSGLKELGAESAQLLLGGSISLAPGWALDLAVSEDIAVDTAPDVVFLLGIRSGIF